MRFPTLLLSLSLSIMFLPTGVAAESVTESYITSTPVVFWIGFGLVVEELDLDDDDEPDTPNIGGVSYVPTGAYVNAVVSISDDVFGSEGGFRACFWAHDGGPVQDVHCTDLGCGSRTLIGSPFEAGRLKSTMYSVLVTEALDVCGSSAGTTTADFF